MGDNPVLSSTQVIFDHLTKLRINYRNLERLAEAAAKKSFKNFQMPFAPDDKSDMINFLMLGGSINFAFKDFEGKGKYETEFQGKTWRGSYGMWAALRRAYDKGIPILDASYLKEFDVEEAKHVFRGNPEMPMLEERAEVFQEIGSVLAEKYNGDFSNLVYKDGKLRRLFDNGEGFIEQLSGNFRCYDDHIVLGKGHGADLGPFYGTVVRFDKKAQLAASSLYRRGLNFRDISQLTVFADYQLPRLMMDKGVFECDIGLNRKIWDGVIIEPGSREEIELRAATVHTCNSLLYRVNELREEPIMALNLDSILFSMSYKLPTPQMLCKTINY